jgi:integrase
MWSYTAGEKGINRIRVYERREAGPIYVEWYDREGRHQQSLRTATNTPVFDKPLAKKLADAMAAAQRKKREGQLGATLLGLPEPHTLGELFSTYHNAHPQWSEKHRREQENNRRFWLLWLGKDTLLTAVTPATAAAAMRRAILAANQEGIGERTQQKRIRYLKDSFIYAQVKEKWIGEKDNLAGLDVPEPDSVSRPYSKAEVAALLPATERVDIRCAAMAYLAWSTGRRANAIRQLSASAYQADGEFGMLRFPGATDKARRAGVVYITGKAKRIVEELLSQPAVKVSGWMFPSGDLDQDDPDRIPDQPVSDQWLRDKLREAEALAGIENVPGRAYHGVKRRFATAVAPHRAAGSKMSGTSEETLRDVYEQDDADPKKELAVYLDSALEERSA